jgi:hypothetical protein
MENEPQDLFLGGKPMRTGYDSYAIYDPSTKKRTGRYISKTPAAAAMKAANRLLKTAKKAVKKTAAPKKGKKGGDPKEGEEMEGEEMGKDFYGGAEATSDNSCKTHYEALGDCMKTGGAKTPEFKKETKTVKFILRKTTRGAMSSGKRVFYHFAATLKTYKTPLVVMRGGERVTIKHKIFVESLDLPAELERMVEARKAKKAAAKKPKAAKAPKSPKAPKAKKSPKTKKPKAAKKPKAKKARAAKRVTGGSSCNMYY